MKLTPLLVFLSGAGLVCGCCKEAMPGPEPAECIVFSGKSATRGSSINGGKLEEVFGSQGIEIRAIHNGTDYFRQDERIFCLGPGLWATSDSYYWPSDAGDALNFWAWAFEKESKAELSNIAATDSTLKFTYRMAEPSLDGADALAQRELLLAGFKGASRKDCPQGVPLGFEHALSAVKIKVGRANAGVLGSIRLKNIYSEAECTYSGPGQIEWSNHSSRKDFCQQFNLQIQGNLYEGNFQDVNAGAQADENGTVFMVIPQQLQDAGIELDYSLAGKDNVEVFTSALEGSWEAGRSYIYTLSILGGLSVSVDGQMEGLSAGSIGFTNNGECPCYLRATMLGCWENSNAEIVQPASGEDKGYYMRVTDAETLSGVFDGISEEIIVGGAKVELSETAQIRDYMPPYMQLPQGTGIQDIHIYTCRCIAYDASSGEFIFSSVREPLDPGPQGITISVDEDGCTMVSVTGFNYKEHWCGPGMTSGRKLIVNIPFELSAINDGEFNPNQHESGLYGPDGSPAGSFEVEPLRFYDLVVQCSGLCAGESAVYRLMDGSGTKILCRFGISADGIGIAHDSSGACVSKTLRNVPQGEYILVEEGWNWAYTTAGSKSVRFTLDGPKTIRYECTHKTGDQSPLHTEVHRAG